MPAPRLPDSDMSAVSRAVAAPVDTFVRPRAVAETGGLFDLAKSLGTLAPTLGVLAADSNRLHAERETEAGVTAGQRGEVTPENASRFRRRAQEETLGIYRDAAEADTARRAAWNSPDNPDRNDPDPEAYNRFLERFRTERLQGMSEDRQRGFLSANARNEQQLTHEVNARRAQVAEENTVNALGTAMVATMRQVIARGGTDAQAIDAAQRASAAVQYAGLSGDKVNDALGTAALAVATETSRDGLLTAAQGDRPDVRAPEGARIPGIRGADWSARFASAQLSIRSHRASEEMRRMQLQEHAERREGTAAIGRSEIAMNEWAAAAEEARKNGQEPPPPPPISAADQAAIARHAPTYLTTYRGAIATLRNAGRQQDPSVYISAAGELHDRVMRGERGGEAYLAVLNSRGITDPTIIGNLQQDARFFDSGEGRSVLTAPAVKAAEQNFLGVIPESRMDAPAVRLLREDARRYFNHNMLAFTARAQREGRRLTEQEIAAEADRLSVLSSTYVRGWMSQDDVSRAAWSPGQPLAAPPATAAPAAPAVTPAAAQPARPGPRLSPEGRVVTPGEAPAAPPAPMPGRDAAVGARAGHVIRGAAGAVADVFATPEVNIPAPAAGVAMTPLVFPNEGIQRRGFSGTGPEVPFFAGANMRAPTDQQTQALFDMLRTNPEDVQAVRAFDAQFGRNAALHYVREFNRRIQGATR